MAAEETAQTQSEAVRYWIRAGSDAAIPFESRWTWAALNRVDRALHDRLREQCSLFDRALLTGSRADIEAKGAATCRGYAKAFQVLGSAAEPDDAYQLGQDPRTGFVSPSGARRSACGSSTARLSYGSHLTRLRRSLRISRHSSRSPLSSACCLVRRSWIFVPAIWPVQITMFVMCFDQ
jgi:hypothetical protein